MSLVHIRYRAYVFVCGALPAQPHMTGRPSVPPPTCLLCIARERSVVRFLESEAMAQLYGSTKRKPLVHPHYEEA